MKNRANRRRARSAPRRRARNVSRETYNSRVEWAIGCPEVLPVCTIDRTIRASPAHDARTMREAPGKAVSAP
jgi:hypothetical protein